MSISEHDINNIDKILSGYGEWFDAHLIRFLDKVIFKADAENFRKLWIVFPEECTALYRHYGWTERQIKERLEMGGIV